MTASKDSSGRITVTFPYDPLGVEMVRHVSTKSLGKITNPLDTLNLSRKEATADKICQRERKL
ncbi:MAG: hypothetical protein GW873_07280 [Nitrospirae bacterium]|nr:hypothetical protein [Nitrospirota bacterium]